MYLHVPSKTWVPGTKLKPHPQELLLCPLPYQLLELLIGQDVLAAIDGAIHHRGVLLPLEEPWEGRGIQSHDHCMSIT